jgi:hypothetical protein
MRYVLDGNRLAAVVAGGAFLALAAVLMQRVKDPAAETRPAGALEVAV